MSAIESVLDTKAITAVRLGDGWHLGVTDFQFFGDGLSNLITQTGAVWQENGCRFSCPLDSILALRSGTPLPKDDGFGRPNVKLQAALKWLEQALQDNMAHEVTALKENAKQEAGITGDTLARAYAQLSGHARPFKDGKIWYWRLEPVNAGTVRVSEE